MFFDFIEAFFIAFRFVARLGKQTLSFRITQNCTAKAFWFVICLFSVYYFSSQIQCR